MHKTFWLTALSLMLGTGTMVFGARPAAQTVNLPEGGTKVFVDDDDEKPDVTARVARISFIRGEVRIKRVGNDDWEKGVLNLPLIEGDEISTGPEARIELQLNNYVHIRLDSDAYLKFAVVREEGVAVSISQGTMNVRVTNMDRAGGYFEIDAPRTTIAVEKAGSYRVDAGKPGDEDLHVSVNNGGAARIYSENAGFTLKSGRRARVLIDGPNAGEWETTEAAVFVDDFDKWSADRDSAIDKRLAAAFYDKYYDQDIYGADDLNGFGEWVYTSAYGYVWRPYSATLAPYANWSPYRYGHWRWLGVYGWTWVNDEPWGWATYHHGRWVYDNGYWVWCPYGYYRPRRSWWFPAVVSITVINNNVCWYPLGYRHRWRNYNNHHGGSGPVSGPVTGPVASGPPAKVRGIDNMRKRIGLSGDVPVTGVLMIDRKDFGTTTRAGVIATPVIAQAVLERPVGAVNDGGLPDRREIDDKLGRDIRLAKPEPQAVAVRATGAAPRQMDRPLDDELKTTRILGDRKPILPVATEPAPTERTRKTGAVDRSVRIEPVPVEPRPVDRSGGTSRIGKDVPATEPQRPIVRQAKPRQEKPYEAPVRPEPTPQPRHDPPTRSEPKNDPPKQQPRPVEKPAEKLRVVDRKGDGKEGR